ncbi:MAG: hypothetical protein V5A34_07930 [Halapricum sp.]
MVDKLQRPHIKENLIGTVAIYALLGFGLFIALLIIPGLGDGESALASTTVGNGMLGFGFGVGLLLAVLRGRDAATLDAEQNVKLVSSFIGNGGGYFVLGLLAVFGASSSSDDLGLSSSGIGGQGGFEVGVGDFFVPLILLAILVGIIGVATVFLEDYL